MKFRIFVLLLVFVSGLLHAETEIDFLEGKVSVAKKKIYLQDIAQINNATTKIKEKLGTMYIRSAAYPGKKVIVTKNRVRNIIRKNYGNVKINGPEQIYVYTSKTTVSKEDIVETAEQYVYDNMPWKKEDVTVVIKGARGDTNVIEGNVLLKVKEDRRNRFKGNVIIPVEIYTDGKFNKIVPVSMTINVVTTCIVASRDIKRRKTVDTSNAKMIRKDITHLPQDVITGFDQLSNKITKRAVFEGSILVDMFFEKIPLFRRGDTVNVVLKMGSMKIETYGTASKDGLEGDVVKITLVTGKTVEGIVSSDGKVIIEK